MRSRYSAFCMGQANYLIETHHPSQRRDDDMQSLQTTIDANNWQGLQVVSTQMTGLAEGDVEFVAYCGDSLEDQLHERSRFVKENGQWYYLDGEILSPRTPGRNEPCWCGSTRKFKRCHG